MFSRTEREFLRIVATGPESAATARLNREFPNPVYRRKLLWGIRRKAENAANDWQLYAVAARQDVRLLPRPPAEATSDVPIFEDPMAAFLSTLLRAFTRRPGRGPVHRLSETRRSR